MAGLESNLTRLEACKKGNKGDLRNFVIPEPAVFFVGRLSKL
jgi:hypothetical protein